MLHQRRPGLRHGDVAEALRLDRQIAGDVRVVLGVTGLVEERAPVVDTAHRLDHEHDAARDLDRRAERPWALLRPLLDVELDVLLRAQVDPEVGEGDLERGNHLLRGEGLVPAGGAEDARDVPALRLRKPDAGARPEEPVGRLFVLLLRRLQHRAALVRELLEREAKTAVEVEVRLRAELRNRALHDLDGLDEDRIEVLVGEAVSRLLQALPTAAVVGVGHRRTDHPVGDRLAVDRRLELGLEGRRLLAVLARQLSEVVLGGEAPELGDAAVAVHGLAQGLRLLEARELGVAVVDRLQVERVLEARVVQVVLLVELGDEPIDAVAVGVELAGGWGRAGQGF